MPLEPITTSREAAAQAILPSALPDDRATSSGGGDSSEEAEILQASIKAGSAAQVVVAVIAVIGLVYLLKLVMVTTLFSILLAFVLEPFVSRLSRIGLPRTLGSLLAVALTAALAIGLTYFFYSRAVDFATQLPKYSVGKPPVAVEVREAPGLSNLISAGSGTLGEVLLAISIMPFLVYFMLTWKDHAHSATVRLFPKEHRLVAHRTVSRISTMIRSFIVGNVMVGLVSAVVNTIVFWRLGIPYFYFLGVISGFVSLIPYLGVFLALLPPFAAGIGLLDKTGVGVILLTVVGLHLLSMNVLYPKIVGKRLRLNPLAVTLSLLFWAWIWGAMGLLLAVPLVGATKIVCDYLEPLRGLGAWLGD
jgi:predicted PurR-regulated permease PerM